MSLEVGEMRGRLETACWPRQVRSRYKSPMKALESELREMRKLWCPHHLEVANSIAFADYCLRRGIRWGYARHRPGQLPPHMEAPGGWPAARCDIRVEDFVKRNPDENLVPYTGWITWMDDGERKIWEHTWCVGPDGTLLDPSTRLCGVKPGWAYIGLPVITWLGMT